MSKPPEFDDTLLAAALQPARPPASLDREGRVRMIGEAAEALIKGELPARDAALFLGGALLAWLTKGGSLERDYFKIVRPKSHVTPSVIWQQLQEAAAHPDEGRDAEEAKE